MMKKGILCVLVVFLITSFWGCEKEDLVNELPQNQLNTTSKKVDVKSVPTLEKFVSNLKKGSDPKLKSRFSPENIQIESSILYRDLTNRLNLYSFLIEDNEFHSIYNLVVETDIRNTEIISSYIMRYEMTDEFANRFYSRKGISFSNFEGTVSKYLYATLFNNTNATNREGDLETCWSLVIEINYGNGDGTGSSGGGGGGHSGTGGDNTTGNSGNGVSDASDGGTPWTITTTDDGIIIVGSGGLGQARNVTLADCKPILECVGVYIDNDGTIIEDTSGWDTNGPPDNGGETLVETLADVLNLDDDTAECIANSGKRVPMAIMNMLNNNSVNSCDPDKSPEEALSNILAAACASGSSEDGITMEEFEEAMSQEEDVIIVAPSMNTQCPAFGCILESMINGVGNTAFCNNFMTGFQGASSPSNSNLIFMPVSFSGDNPFNFDLQDAGNGATFTNYSSSGEINSQVILFNTDNCNSSSSNIEVFETIQHELFHAYINQTLISMGANPSDTPSMEEALISLSQEVMSSGASDDHEYMLHFLTDMVNSIIEFNGGNGTYEDFVGLVLNAFGDSPEAIAALGFSIDDVSNYLDNYQEFISTPENINLIADCK